MVARTQPPAWLRVSKAKGSLAKWASVPPYPTYPVPPYPTYPTHVLARCPHLAFIASDTSTVAIARIGFREKTTHRAHGALARSTPPNGPALLRVAAAWPPLGHQV